MNICMNICARKAVSGHIGASNTTHCAGAAAAAAAEHRNFIHREQPKLCNWLQSAVASCFLSFLIF